MSSWLRTAVHKAAEVGHRNNLARIRNYADSVVQQAGQAVVGGAKLLQDRIGNRNLQSFRLNVKRLEELSVSCRGSERILLLRRWLVSLKEIERISKGYCDNNEKTSDGDNADESRQANLVLYHDLDNGGEPLNFRDVFLHSQALEGIILSMILEAPNVEEEALLLEIFGLCLMGGKDIHNAVMRSVLELANVFSNYDDEILMKREELLQYAQSSISGLKINADQARIDVEVASLKRKLSLMEGQLPPGRVDNQSSDDVVSATTEALKEALAQVQSYSKLKTLLLEKKTMHNGDPPETHAEKIHKMKVLLESLFSSTSKAENRIIENRSRKEEALHFRLARVNEVDQVDKELVAEIATLERRKDELEAELKRVNTSLTASNARLRNAREERHQFDEASNEIIQHLQTKEEELSRSVTSCRKEAEVVTTWISFVENTWGSQSSCEKLKEEQVNDELVRYAEYFVDLILQLLPAYKNELAKSFTHFQHLVQKLRVCEGSDKAILYLDYENHGEDITTSARNRKHLEEEYLDLEAKLITTFSVVESIKQIYIQNEDFSRKYDQMIKELLDALQKIKEEFDNVERPTLRVETPRLTLSKSTPLKFSPLRSPKKLEMLSSIRDVYSRAGTVVDGNYLLDSDEEQAALESEFVSIIRNHAAEENDWEF